MLNPSNHLKPGSSYTDSECSAHTSPSFGSLSYSQHHRPSTPLYSTHSPSLTAENIINDLFIEETMYNNHHHHHHIEYGTKYILTSQARVKTERELTSEYITDLPAGSLVEIDYKIGDRLRLCAPINGWISCRSKHGQMVLSKASKADEMDWEIRLESIGLIPHQPPNWVFDLFWIDYPEPHVYKEEFAGFDSLPLENEAEDAEEEWNEWSKELKAAEMIYQRALRGAM